MLLSTTTATATTLLTTTTTTTAFPTTTTTDVCNFLNTTRVCTEGSGELDFEAFCEVPVNSARPLFCTNKCSQPIIPYDCFNIKTVNKTNEELTGGFYQGNNILIPGTAVLHQWTPLDDNIENWAAGLISITGPDLILWEPLAQELKGSALHLPTLSLVSEYTKPLVVEENSTTTILIPDTTPTEDPEGTTTPDTTTIEGITSTPTTSDDEPTPRPNSLELLYILDTHNTLKVDAWYKGRYQGYAAFEIQKNSVRAWEPVFQNLSNSSFEVFFATTKYQDVGDLNLKNIFSS